MSQIVASLNNACRLRSFRLGLLACLCLSLASCGVGTGDQASLQVCLDQVKTAQNQCNINNGNTANGAKACTAVALVAIASCNSQYGLP